MSKDKVLEALNLEFYGPQKDHYQAYRKKEETPGFSDHKPAVPGTGNTDFELFNINRKDKDDQRLLGSCVPAPGEAGPSVFSLHPCCQEEEGVNEGPWPVLAGTQSQGQVGGSGRACVSLTCPQD